jgi:hypothetical protein
MQLGVFLLNNLTYLDNSATTAVCPTAIEYINSALLNYGNPSSLHIMGMKAEDELIKTRDAISNLLECRSDEIYFTSGGTEANNLVLLGAAYAKAKRGCILITEGEHASVENCAAFLEKDGFKVEVIYKDGSASKGIVTAQSHTKSTKLEKGTTITLTVSTGIMSYEYKLVVKEDILSLNFKDEYKDMTLSFIIDGTTKLTTQEFDANVRENEFEFTFNDKNKEAKVTVRMNFSAGGRVDAVIYTIDMVKGEIKSKEFHKDLDPSNADSKYLVVETTPDEGGSEGEGGGDQTNPDDGGNGDNPEPTL